MKAWGNFVLRVGLAAVFGWFGIDKFIHPIVWVKWVPQYVINILPFSEKIFIFILGGIESLLALFFLLGLFTRLAGIIASLLLLSIIATAGINEITMRDIAILGGALSLAFSGATGISIDSIWRSRGGSERDMSRDDDLRL